MPRVWDKYKDGVHKVKCIYMKYYTVEFQEFHLHFDIIQTLNHLE